MKPKLLPSCGGWHIIGSDDKPCGFIHRIKGFNQRIIHLRGTVKEIKEIIDSGILTKT